MKIKFQNFSDPDVLNGINWSGDLDEIFKKNGQEFPGIYWQSFGSRNGYLRVYPAARQVFFGEILKFLTKL